MSDEKITIADVKDKGISKALKQALADKYGKTLSVADVENIVKAALGDIDGKTKLKLDRTEVKDLLTIMKRSTSMIDFSKQHVRDAILINYTQKMIKDKGLRAALQKELKDGTLKDKDVDQIIGSALKSKKGLAFDNTIIEDLLLLSKHVSQDWSRPRILGTLLDNVKPNSAPPTVVESFQIQNLSDKGGKYSVIVKVLTDKMNDRTVKRDSANTVCIPKPSPSQFKYEIDAPANKKLKELKTFPGWPRITALEIQTKYRPRINKNKLSGYGRGTEDKDIKNGDVTIGFHEKCHRDDFKSFIRSKVLPTFGGNKDMTVGMWNQAVKKYKTELEKYLKDGAEYSRLRTDEKGYKQSEEATQSLVNLKLQK